ncbi:MAG: RsmB/NOP family class I SAM-dependent RNA methyltransferase [Proteobacteria bacterium]|nr:RsmB/NOP family class I SAM-dependent RNA methyltransferase [Pseudomonadota bacterium]MDA0862914.1 RsmB/NOP family class I SAM-dependent RNA methyltransferase [Pseudomonadota bacterium]MDA1030804.1 RsmB/NOP family class I SAM-dependent RNA methyltransferase [Pseudomonadota bacterium]
MEILNPKLFDATVAATAEILKLSSPADIMLSRYFRNNRSLGSHERPLIADVVYSVIRNKTYLEKISGSTDAPTMCLTSLNKIFGLSLTFLKANVAKKWHESIENLKERPTPELSPEDRYSIPDWLWNKMNTQYGLDGASNLAQALLAKAPFDLRVNQVRASRKQVLAELASEGITGKATPLSSLGIRIKENFGLQKHRLFLEGHLEVQDEGSQILAQLVGAKRGQMVVDFCAGAGGKTLALGAMMSNQGRLYAFDVSAKRLERLKPRLKRSGLSNVQTQLIGSEKDPRIQRLAGKIDRVLIDAPCSGLGTLRRNPDMKWRQSEKDISSMAEKQLRILSAASKLVKKDGLLIYGTCSILRDENESVIENFLAEHQGKFEPVDAAQSLSIEGIDSHNTPYLKLLPNTHGCDGFFAAILRAM